MNLHELQHEFFARVNACNSVELFNSGVIDLGISYTPVRADFNPLLHLFARACPVPLLWVDLANVGDTFKQLMLPTNPPFYHAIKKEIFMLSPTYFKTDAHCKHALLHETAHHIHFKEFGFNLSTRYGEAKGRMTNYFPACAYNIAEMVAETAATLAATAMMILTPNEWQGCAEYVSMYRVGQGIPTQLPTTKAIFIIPIAEKLISLYKDTNV